MYRTLRTQMRPAAVALLAFTVVTGVLYPLCITAAARLLFPHESGGSLVLRDGATVGSQLIGQPFGSPGYFWGRPSATSQAPYNAAASGGSNLGPANPALVAAVDARVKALRAVDPGNTQPVPVDLVTASASGLDPHISPAAARYQARRVAAARGLNEAQVLRLIARFTQGRQWGLLGETRVNVLTLNMALDDVAPRGGER